MPAKNRIVDLTLQDTTRGELVSGVALPIGTKLELKVKGKALGGLTTGQSRFRTVIHLSVRGKGTGVRHRMTQSSPSTDTAPDVFVSTNGRDFTLRRPASYIFRIMAWAQLLDDNTTKTGPTRDEVKMRHIRIRVTK